MTDIESQLKVVKAYIRSAADGSPEAFECLPARGPELEAIRLRACAAELKKYRVTFRCLGSGTSDMPEELVWPMRLDTQSGQLICNVGRVVRVLNSEEGAKAILEQLKQYCADYEKELQSFYDC